MGSLDPLGRLAADLQQPAVGRVGATRLAFDRGGGTMLEVIDAQRTLNAARQSRARIEGRKLADAVRLFAATGADWRTA